jgi:hypothetical protein
MNEAEMGDRVDVLWEAAPVDANDDPGVGQQAVWLLEGADISISASCQPMLLQLLACDPGSCSCGYNGYGYS